MQNMPQRQQQAPAFAIGQAVWVKLPLEFGVEYECVAWVLRVLANEPRQPILYEVQGTVRERYTVQEEWLSTQRPTSSSVVDGSVARLSRVNPQDSRRR
jgi:hypothetical protein